MVGRSSFPMILPGIYVSVPAIRVVRSQRVETLSLLIFMVPFALLLYRSDCKCKLISKKSQVSGWHHNYLERSKLHLYKRCSQDSQGWKSRTEVWEGLECIACRALTQNNTSRSQLGRVLPWVLERSSVEGRSTASF